MPSVVVSLRAVLPDERSLGLGLQSIILRLVGTIPGPVFFGYVIDNVCLLWDQDCGEGDILPLTCAFTQEAAVLKYR